ncbi:rhamnosyltransferase [Xenorhabdus sp. TH1]|uniref:rhamnosyltransferase n=1 Tax=Xenorhabdus sp. TH1 TaxID=3130166 RepID=UPI0030D16FA3
MTVSTPSVTAILVTFNPDLKSFGQVIDSISTQVKYLIIVDNGSKDISEIKKVAVATGCNFILLEQKNNIGLASAQNIGIEYVKHNLNTSHIILFDQDSIINTDFIIHLLEEEQRLNENGVRVGAIGPSFYDPDNNNVYPATVYNGPFIQRVELKDEPVEATFLIASGCLIKMAVLNDVGKMLDDLFIDYIDVEWSLRAKKKGYKVFITPKASMAHTIGDKRVSIFGRTISSHSSFRRYFLVRNSFLMIRLSYIPFGYKLREIVFNFIRIIIGFATSSQKKVFIKYTIAALKDGFLKKFGPCKYKF